MENLKKGGISVETEHIFPVIKKWLYSEKDIFLREIVSNACDAVTKLRRLASLGQYDAGDETYRIDVILDKEAKTLTVADNGIGMTAEEVDRYICQIALSGALEFVQKYEGDNKNNGIIGHFGLGFYSAFMVSDSVELVTKSYTDAPAVKWTCSADGQYEMMGGERDSHGTSVIMHISDEESEYLEKFKIEGILDRYCAFMPVEIYFTVEGEEPPKAEDGKEPEAPKPVNDIHPLWLKNPSECTPEEYKDFYRKVFHDYREPLFWIHINADYPLNFRGILYFPKLNNEYESIEGQVKLYYNQVFVADNIKEIIPEFLLMLKGVIDCPDVPLNVSRSFLQNDGYVTKISNHITKKVADKLTGLFKNDRENYSKYWDDINIFIKYGCIRDEKFYEKIKDAIIYKNLDGKYITLDEYLDGKEKKDVYYVSDEKQQAQYINMFKEQNLDAVILPAVMDTHFISFLETKLDGVKFHRIDSALSETAEEDKNDDSDSELIEKFKKEINDDSLKIEVHALKNASVPAVMLLGEQSRRMQEMYRSYGQQMAGMADMFKNEYTLVINKNNELIKKLGSLNDEDASLLMDHIYDMARISHSPLTGEQMTKFIERSNKLLEKIF